MKPVVDMGRLLPRMSRETRQLGQRAAVGVGIYVGVWGVADTGPWCSRRG